ASNNIYEQQYQMHRFVTDFYKKPVAVNDIGWVSYKNDGYVLDLYGLASIEALKLRQAGGNDDWMSRLAKSKDVELAMVYDDDQGFIKKIPATWRKIGQLRLSKRRITPSRASVAFYALTPGATEEIRDLAEAFSRTLPPGVL